MSIKQQLVPVSLRDIEVNGGLWAQRQIINRSRTIPAIHKQLQSTGRLDAWDLSQKRERPKRRSVIHMFWDSDSGKWIEAAGYSLQTHPDPELEKQVDELVNRIQQAQQPDGYLNSYFTVVEPENRWKNLRDWHELYNAGHLIEGAVAYFQATGKRTLLDALIRNADHIDARFGSQPGQKRGYPGHPEIELALVKLYHTTGESRYLKLAQYFIDERGQQPYYFDIEAAERSEDPADFWAKTYRYCQAHEPIREQVTATGHAVRACYLYAGTADVARETNDQQLLEVMRRLWDDLTAHQMYITGGLGPAHANEGFTFAYDLPNESAYAETCASIALVFWAQRMFRIDPNSRYIDVMERALYNGILSGVSQDGEHFFYANPLSSYPNVSPYEDWSGIISAQFYRRAEWFECPCCPPNVARLVASIGSYFYSVTGDTCYVHLYNTSHMRAELNGTVVEIEQHTHYPWEGEINLRLQLAQPTQFRLALRIPGWCRDFDLSVNGGSVSQNPREGYIYLDRAWANSDEIRLSLKMPIERMVAHPHVRMNAGHVALQRGPIVYCLEEIDNGAHLANVVIPHDAPLTATWDESLLGGVSIITGDAVRIEPTQTWTNGLYQSQSSALPVHSPFPLKAVPYYSWANREPGEMRVWLREG